MKVAVQRRVRFSAAHSYRNIPDSLRRRPARIHGHNYVVDVAYAGDISPATGMVVNITAIDAVLKRIVGPLDSSYLEEDHPGVSWGIPTTENLALWIWGECQRADVPADLRWVRVMESEHLWAYYEGSADNSVKLTRVYDFAAAHRLHSSALSDEENAALFGKCNNPNYHGHNYGLEVTVSGPIDPRTGMVCDLDTLDDTVTRLVLERLDHRNLNLDVGEFASLNPTAENIAVVIWRMLEPELGRTLSRICVRETERNYFEYFGEG